ncbi:flavin reductase [Pelagivirga sediminicola]|uniref:Flavin reductase n=1 Tax=Pelagivirga sediminicola TaxID=2170575 RepID=A0A2T7G888_9RHOB|nr:flavin reductase family protein [Pelagivirga sediminicola]PVA10628.1 flavin reductase [Pelagivirga sediminicola]
MTAPIDPRELRNALGAFATGVTVVTATQADGTPRGFTANSFTSVSLDPPLVLVCVAKTAGSCEVMEASDHMAINILAEDQRDVSGSFASRNGTRFEGVDWWTGASGAPILPGTAAMLDCTMERTIEAGDHVILMGRVIDFAHTSVAPLGYCRGAYVSFGAERAALEAASSDHPVRYGMIVEHDDALLLDEAQDGSLCLPTARRLGGPEQMDGLIEDLQRRGIDVAPEFIFAVFDDPEADRSFIYYRGTANAVAPDAASRFVRFDDLALSRLADAPTRSMVARFISERRDNAFGVYTGSAQAGRISPLAKAAAKSEGAR